MVSHPIQEKISSVNIEARLYSDHAAVLAIWEVRQYMTRKLHGTWITICLRIMDQGELKWRSTVSLNRMVGLLMILWCGKHSKRILGILISAQIYTSRLHNEALSRLVWQIEVLGKEHKNTLAEKAKQTFMN